MMIELDHAIQSPGPPQPNTPPPWAQHPIPPPADLHEITQQCITVFLASKSDNGGIRGIGWWQQANAYTAIALHSLSSPSPSSSPNLPILIDLLQRSNDQRKPNFINEFNDDTLWWGLCSLHVFNLTHDDWFLSRAKAVWDHLPSSNSIIAPNQLSFKGLDMGGGCFWTTKPDEEQVNAITTGLFAELSVRLALHEQRARASLGGVLKRTHPACLRYVEYAERSLAWILRCRYRAREAVVLDNVLVGKQEARDWVFSYNTGVAIGVCALLFEATEERRFLELACRMANAAMRRGGWVEENGVLDEPGAYGKGKHDPAKNNDAVGFKSVLVRGLGTLFEVVRKGEEGERDEGVRRTAELIGRFVNVNLHSQQTRNTNGKGQYGPWWNGPFEMPTSHSQMAVLDVMAAAVLVNRM